MELEQKPLKVFIIATKEEGFEGYPEYPTNYAIGDLPNVRLTNRGELLKPGEYTPVTKDGRRCDLFNCRQDHELRKIMDDVEEHPIVRYLAEQEFKKRLVRDYVPNTRSGETKEQKMAKILESAINNCGFYQEKMAEYFCQYAHRYLDHSLFTGFIRNYILIHAWKWRNSKHGGPYYDGRNEYACERCSKIVDALEWGYYYDEYCREMEKKMNR